MNRLEQEIRLTELSHLTRRHFLSKCTTGLGAMWASTMLGNQLYGASEKLVKDPSNPLGSPQWVIIGASFAKTANGAQAREWINDRDLRRHDVGFRIAYDHLPD